MQQHALVLEEERSRVGRLNSASTIAKTRTKRRKRSKRKLTEPGFDAVIATALAIGVGLYLVAQVVPGLPAVLRAHGI
ncbi:hypothetical protein D3C86_1801230 [compost metagenome]